MIPEFISRHPLYEPPDSPIGVGLRGAVLYRGSVLVPVVLSVNGSVASTETSWPGRMVIPHDGGGGHRPPPLHTPPPAHIYIYSGPVSRFPVVGRGRPTGDFELKSSSRIESEVVGQSQAKLGWSA